MQSGSAKVVPFMEVSSAHSYLHSFLFAAAVGAGASGCGAEYTHH